MSTISQFLRKHADLVAELAAAYTKYNVVASEIGLQQSTFPAIGLFLGSSEFSRDSRAYAPIEYTYILCVFDEIELDDAAAFLTVQQETFDKLEAIIVAMGYNVLTEIEPIVSLGVGEGTFITGWTTTIKFNA